MEGMVIMGTVTVSKVNKSNFSKSLLFSKKYNHITNRLSKGIARYLAGDFNNISQTNDFIPRYLGVGNGANTAISVETSTTAGTSDPEFGLSDLLGPIPNKSNPTRVPITSKEIDLVDMSSSSNTKSTVTVKAFIPPALIESGQTINELGLFSDISGANLVSRLKLTDKDIITVEAGFGIDIVWVLSIYPASN